MDPSVGYPSPIHDFRASSLLAQHINELKQGAKQDNPDALCTLGYCYQSGIGVRENKAKAFQLYLKAALIGHIVAMRNVGNCYYYGIGTEKNGELAFLWSGRAAELGNADAQCIHGNCYDNTVGISVRQPEKGIEWYKKSAAQNWPRGIYNLGVCYENGDGIAKDPAKAVEMYLTAANLGYPSAQYNLAVCFERGVGTPQDYATALEWYKKAANQGHQSAACNLGYMYEMGQGTPVDVKKAVEYYLKAAEAGNAVAMFNMALSYEDGTGVPKDPKSAFDWFVKSATKGDADAQQRVGIYYEEGRDAVEPNLPTAFEWYSKAASSGNIKAKIKVATALQLGLGVERNETLAAKMLFEIGKTNYKAKEILRNNPGLCRLLLAEWPSSHFKLTPEFQTIVLIVILSLQERQLPEELHSLFVYFLVLVWPEDVGIPFTEIVEDTDKTLEMDIVH